MPVNDDALSTVEVLSIRDCFVVGGKLKHLAVEQLSLEQLKGNVFIMLEKGSSTRDHIESFLASQGVAISPEIELSSIDLIAEFTRNDVGVGAVLRDFVEAELRDAALVELNTQPQLPTRTIGVVS